jgi:hypothetical protein
MTTGSLRELSHDNPILKWIREGEVVVWYRLRKKRNRRGPPFDARARASQDLRRTPLISTPGFAVLVAVVNS